MATLKCNYIVSNVCSLYSTSGPLSYTDWIYPINSELFVISSFYVEDYSSLHIFYLKLSKNSIYFEFESYFYLILSCFYLNYSSSLSRIATKYYYMKLLRCPIWATNFCISNLIWYPFFLNPSIFWSNLAN